jgi:hypothetical protein
VYTPVRDTPRDPLDLYRYGCLYAQPCKHNGYRCVTEVVHSCVIIGVATIWMCNFSFNVLILLTFMTDVWANSAWNKQLLDLRTFAAEELPDDGTLVPKHVGVGTDMKCVS